MIVRLQTCQDDASKFFCPKRDVSNPKPVLFSLPPENLRKEIMCSQYMEFRMLF